MRQIWAFLAVAVVAALIGAIASLLRHQPPIDGARAALTDPITLVWLVAAPAWASLGRRRSEVNRLLGNRNRDTPNPGHARGRGPRDRCAGRAQPSRRDLGNGPPD